MTKRRNDMSVKLLRTRAQLLCSVLALLASACASDTGPGNASEEKNEIEGSSQESLIQAGAASQAAGVSRWQAEKSGNRALFQGFNEQDELVTEFQLDNDTRLVESRLPDVGARQLDDGKPGSMSAASAVYVDALASDLEAAYNGAAVQAASQVDDKVFQSCFTTLYQCNDIGWYGYLKYWWEAWDCHRYIPPCTGNNYALLTNR